MTIIFENKARHSAGGNVDQVLILLNLFTWHI